MLIKVYVLCLIIYFQVIITRKRLSNIYLPMLTYVDKLEGLSSFAVLLANSCKFQVFSSLQGSLHLFDFCLKDWGTFLSDLSVILTWSTSGSNPQFENHCGAMLHNIALNFILYGSSVLIPLPADCRKAMPQCWSICRVIEFWYEDLFPRLVSADLKSHRMHDRDSTITPTGSCTRMKCTEDSIRNTNAVTSLVCW